MKTLLRFLFYRPAWQKLPMMNRMYSSEFHPDQADQDIQTLMQLTHVRCPQGVEVLKDRHGASTARELIERLPARRRKLRPLKRVISLLQRLFGFTPYDPNIRLAKEYRQRIKWQ